MNAYLIPLALLYIPVFIAVWLLFGLFWRSVVFAIYPDMRAILSPTTQRWMLYLGPLGVTMGLELMIRMPEVKRIQAEKSARKTAEIE